MFEKLSEIKLNFKAMKTFAITLLLFVFGVTVYAASPAATVAAHNNGVTIVASRNADAKGLEMRLRGTGHINVGSAITAELFSTYDGEAQMVVENASGKRFAEQVLTLEKGKNLIKMNIAEIPAGIYFIKVKVDGKSETTTFVVK